MAAPSFDPRHAVRFDLPQGAVHAGADGDRVLLVPAGAMEDLVLSAPPEAVEALGRALGAAIGRRAAARMGDANAAPIEASRSASVSNCRIMRKRCAPMAERTANSC